MALSKKYFDKKNKRTAQLSVGDTPAMTPGSLERYGPNAPCLTCEAFTDCRATTVLL